VLNTKNIKERRNLNDKINVYVCFPEMKLSVMTDGGFGVCDINLLGSATRKTLHLVGRLWIGKRLSNIKCGKERV
jgi:hypothetical protein